MGDSKGKITIMWDGTNIVEIMWHLESVVDYSLLYGLFVKTSKGRKRLNVGDYINRGPRGGMSVTRGKNS